MSNEKTEKMYSEAELQLAVNDAMAQGVRQRMAAVASGGYDFADTLHNIYLDFGYPSELSFFNYWNMYRRFGVARRVVELYPDQTWLDDPIIESNNPQFMRDLEILINRWGLWRRLRGLDTRQRVGRYGGMFFRVRDDRKPEQPIPGKLNGIGSLVDMIPLYESQLKVETTEDDPRKENFGLPTRYEFNSGVVGNRNDRANANFAIDPSRIVIAAEDSDNSNIYGISSLEAVYNSLMDLRKVIGGGAEGFYKNAAQTIVFDLADPASAKNNEALLNKFNEQYDDFAKNRARRAMWTPGMKSNVLDSTMVQPEQFFKGALQDISAGSGIPSSLLIGNQTGRLAGDQDSKGFLQSVQSRRVEFATDMVRDVIDWLAVHGILPEAEYTIEWPDALAPSSEEKLKAAGDMADINQKTFLSGGIPPFTSEEIREAAGFDPEEAPELPDENDRGDNPNAD